MIHAALAAMLWAQDEGLLNPRRPGPRLGDVPVSIAFDRSSAAPGETIQMSVVFDVPPGQHIYPPIEQEATIPSKIVPVAREGLTFGPARWPEAHAGQTGAFKGTLMLEGRVVAVMPLTVARSMAPGTIEVEVKVDYQVCTDQVCAPPRRNVSVKGELTIAGGAGGPAPAPPAASGDASFLVMLGFAFLGGLLLNVMPCVLPVLTMKLVGLVEQKDLAAGARRAGALAYTAGVLWCLGAFAGAIVILQRMGKAVGWGFQFQEPGFVIALTTLIFVFGLSLLGVFHIPAMATGAAARAGRAHGTMGHLFTGLLVTLVATPCSAPFLGTGLGFALKLPAWGVFLFFGVAGLGLAFPFLLVGFVPALLRFLPKPGPWLPVFEKFMGFTLIATAVWLTGTIGKLTGQEGLTGFLAFLTAVSLGAWIFGRWGSEIASGRARLLSLAVAVALSVAAGKLFLVTEPPPRGPAAAAPFRTEGLDYNGRIPWQPFSEEAVAAIRGAGKPGFIDFTADW
jgi:thiol:disulfide interchange protein